MRIEDMHPLFHKNICALRSKLDMSQKKIALMLGIERARYSAWEQGISEPPLIYLCKLAELHDISLDTLLKVKIPKNKTLRVYLKRSGKSDEQARREQEQIDYEDLQKRHLQ